MCRLFALRAERPTRLRESLLESPCSLLRQSRGDRRGVCHANGWGVGWYVDGRPRLERAATAADQDPGYRALVEAVCASTVLAHVRQASVGDVSVKNTHPFAHGRWLFAHNGTLQGFAADPTRVRRLIPRALLKHVEGETDSEHLFYYLLGRLGPKAVKGAAAADYVADVVCASMHTLATLFPGTETEPSQLNVVLTDGQNLIATRWGHTLFWLARNEIVAADSPVEAAALYCAIAVASEPTTTESAWEEIPDRALLVIRPDLSHAIAPLTAPVR